MKIGYPCLNYTIGCQANKTFRLASYTDERFIETAANNIQCLKKILEFNVANDMLFFRISSELLPFASHPILKVNWLKHFNDELRQIGVYIKQHDLRISMHPDQFVLINSPRREVVEKSIQDLIWHCQLLDALGLDLTAKVQIHVGGVYGNKVAAIKSFVENYKKLPELIKRRLVIENDDKCFNLADCMKIHDEIGIPIIFDNFHHECLHQSEGMKEAVLKAASTWKKKDGILMLDYSSQQKGAIKGKHIESIDINLFENFLKLTKELDFDIMLEIKDKELSAAKALASIKKIRCK